MCFLMWCGVEPLLETIHRSEDYSTRLMHSGSHDPSEEVKVSEVFPVLSRRIRHRNALIDQEGLGKCRTGTRQINDHFYNVYIIPRKRARKDVMILSIAQGRFKFIFKVI